MLNENLKKLRKRKGFSQEEMAIKLNVVRQTISKWENGLSVPDSDMLIKIAEVLESSVGELLGEKLPEEGEANAIQEIAAKLELLNEQFAKQAENRRKWQHRIWVAVLLLFGGMLIMKLLPCVQGYILAKQIEESTAIIGGSDGPTAVFVADGGLREAVQTAVSVIAVILAGVGMMKTRRKK